jgi:hypothetical protein
MTPRRDLLVKSIAAWIVALGWIVMLVAFVALGGRQPHSLIGPMILIVIASRAIRTGWKSRPHPEGEPTRITADMERVARAHFEPSNAKSDTGAIRASPDGMTEP